MNFHPKDGDGKDNTISRFVLLNYVARPQGVREIKVGSFGLPSRLGGLCCSAGVSPAVAGASRSRMQEAQPALEKRSIATPDEAQEGAGRMPAPQRARRPRYSRWIGLTFMSRTPPPRIS